MADNVEYIASRRKDYKSGLFVMPMATGDPVLVRLHGAYEVITTPFAVVGKDGMPDIPSPDMVRDEELIGGHIDAAVPTNHVEYVTYAVHGAYVHIASKPTGLTKMAVGQNPADLNLIPAAKLEPKFFVSMIGLQRAHSPDQGF